MIPTLDEAGCIERTVGRALDGGAEVWVVDGGSRDATRERASAAGARVLLAERGRARQLAAGVEASRGEGVVFLHADTLLPPRWRPAVEATLSKPEVSGGAFAFRFERTPERRLGLRLAFVEWGARLRVALLGWPYGDQGLFVRRSVLQAIGGVPQTPIMEDLDLVSAMRRFGRIECLAIAAVTSPRRYLRQGPLRTMLRNWVATLAWACGLDRARIAAWYQRAEPGAGRVTSEALHPR
ncbi:MAG TPA: TIGR04283 family arsenosugar biosynthesis glycosyltransferase [Myxococcota bacterium]|nr:TIGR04283 family arsenosugar biosynthesis glycosyltransferase [Myxococcota bacterium]